MIKTQAEIVKVVRNNPDMCLTQLLTAVGMNVVGSNYGRLRSIIDGIPSLELYRDGKAVKVRLKPFSHTEAIHPIKELRAAVLAYLDNLTTIIQQSDFNYAYVKQLHTEANSLLQATNNLNFSANLVLTDIANSQARFNKIVPKLCALGRESISL